MAYPYCEKARPTSSFESNFRDFPHSHPKEKWTGKLQTDVQLKVHRAWGFIATFKVDFISLLVQYDDASTRGLFMDISDLQGETTTLSVIVRNWLPIDTAPYPHNISYTAA
jgi:hypothetical protein